MAKGSTQQFYGIQALRFIAALLVVITHSMLYAQTRLADDFPIWSHGPSGVDIFFVISGFVMVMSSGHLLGRDDGASTFLKHRLARIVPLYWCVTTFKLVVLLAVPALAMKSQIDWYHVITSYLFIPSFSPAGDMAPLLEVGWSLNFEMLFYVVFASAIALRRDPVVFTTVVMVALAIGGLYRGDNDPAVALMFWCDTQVLEFVAGMLIARLSQSGWKMPRGLILAMTIAGIAGLLYEWPFSHKMMRVLWWGIPAAMIVAAVAFSEGTLHKFVPPWMRLLGDSSYSLYLIHPILAPMAPALLAKLGIRLPWLSVGLSIVIALVSSVIVYRVFEKPVTVALKRMLEPRRLTTRTVAP